LTGSGPVGTCWFSKEEQAMATETVGAQGALLQYVHEVGVREDAHLERLRAETSTLRMAIMQISPEQGQFLAFLMELIGARRAIEVGTFTGYSAMWIAKGMGPEGRLIAMDVNPEYAQIARRHWAEAQLSDRITLRLAPAAQSLAAMLPSERGTYDFVFVDADKPGYDGYYERALELLRPGGVIACDNALLEGGVIDPENHTADVVAMRAFNRKLLGDPRVSVSLVPIRDGLYLARKR
jgi:predicted O-methyltransferase YrrM